MRDDATARYRYAERALWSHYAIEPVEHVVDVRSPQVRLRINEVGAGEPVLFVHGMLGTGPYWGPLLRQLSGFRCLILDRPGYGLSSALDWSTHDMGATTADLVVAALDELGVQRVDVIGGSIGGVLGLHVARRHPARVGRIVMLGGGPLVRDFPVPFAFRVMASPLGFVVERLGRKEKVMRSIIGSSGHQASLADGRIPDAFVDWRVALQRDTASMRNERAGLRAIIGPEGWRPSIAMADSELAAIHHPTLLLQGSGDPTASTALWERVMRVLPQVEMQVVEGAGHQPWLDAAETIGASVSQFLRR
jgi:pimeloyl-ACP methyl ester carboxylesterase